MTENQRQAELALRALQKLDELQDLGTFRYLLVEAETALGEVLGLECTGKVDGTDEDGSPAYYSHDGPTCPIHEWLDEDDYTAIVTARTAVRQARDAG